MAWNDGKGHFVGITLAAALNEAGRARILVTIYDSLRANFASDTYHTTIWHDVGTLPN